MADRPIVIPGDPLAAAALTPEERAAWKKFRTDYARMQEQLVQLQARQEAAESEAPHGMILSRPEFNREVARLLALEARYGGTSSLVYFDCGNLGQLTAQFSRSVTNAAIRAISDTLLRHIRGCDIAGRLEADEFGVLLVRCKNEDAWRKAELLAAQMRDAVAAIHDHPFELTAGFGVYTFAGGDDAAHGIQAAAKAMLGKAARG